MNAATSEIWSAMIDAEQVETEIESLNMILGYLTGEIENGTVSASSDGAKAVAVMRRVATFCKMLYAVNTGIDAQLKERSKSISTCYDCVNAMRQEDSRQ